MLPPRQTLLLLAPLAYLLGSTPFGLLVGLSKGVDPRKAGSGNIGATNVGRLLGKRFFAIVFTLDLLKGLIPMVVADVLVRSSGQTLDWIDYLLWLLIGFAAITGHMFSIFLRFKGGKGVATSTGVMLGVFPYYTLASLVAVPAFFTVLKTTRYVSAASIAAAVGFPLGYAGIGLLMGWPIFGSQLPLLIFAIVVGLLIVIKHRGNIARIRAGTEPKTGQAR
jgi:acyl phosphate:glycerol-3-phosphate acyltransferase